MTATPSQPPTGAATDVNHFEDFEVGGEFHHHWGRTFGQSESIEFATQFLVHETRLFNARYAAALGHHAMPVSPLYVFAVVLGMSVEDLSESGGPFLGADNLCTHAPVYPGDTVFGSSIVLEKRESRSRRRYGIVRWRTRGMNQDGIPVISFERTNLVRKRNAT